MRTTFIILLLAVFSTRALPLYKDSRISESLELDAVLLVPSPSPEPSDIVLNYLDNSNMYLSFLFGNHIIAYLTPFGKEVSSLWSKAENLFVKYK